MSQTGFATKVGVSQPVLSLFAKGLNSSGGRWGDELEGTGAVTTTGSDETQAAVEMVMRLLREREARGDAAGPALKDLAKACGVEVTEFELRRWISALRRLVVSGAVVRANGVWHLADDVRKQVEQRYPRFGEREALKKKARDIVAAVRCSTGEFRARPFWKGHRKEAAQLDLIREQLGVTIHHNSSPRGLTDDAVEWLSICCMGQMTAYRLAHGRCPATGRPDWELQKEMARVRSVDGAAAERQGPKATPEKPAPVRPKDGDKPEAPRCSSEKGAALELLRSDEMAKILRTSPAAFRSAVRKGLLPQPIRVPGVGLRWRKVDLIECLERASKAANP